MGQPGMSTCFSLGVDYALGCVGSKRARVFGELYVKMSLMFHPKKGKYVLHEDEGPRMLWHFCIAQDNTAVIPTLACLRCIFLFL